MKAELLGDSEEKLALLTFWDAAFCAGVESVAIGMALPESRGLGADSVWLHFWGALSGMFAEMGDNYKQEKAKCPKQNGFCGFMHDCKLTRKSMETIRRIREAVSPQWRQALVGMDMESVMEFWRKIRRNKISNKTLTSRKGLTSDSSIEEVFAAPKDEQMRWAKEIARRSNAFMTDEKLEELRKRIAAALATLTMHQRSGIIGNRAF